MSSDGMVIRVATDGSSAKGVGVGRAGVEALAEQSLKDYAAQAGRKSEVAIVIHSATRIIDLRDLHIFSNLDSERHATVETETMADGVDFGEIECDSKWEEASSWNSNEALAWRRRSWRFDRHHSEVIELSPAGSVHEQAPHHIDRGVHDRGRAS